MTSRDRVRFYINNTATYKNTYRKTNVGDCTEYSPCFAHPTRWPWSGSLNPSMSLSSSLYMFLKLAVKGTSVDTATDEIDQINYQPKAHQLSQSYIQVSAVHLTKLGLIKIDLPPLPYFRFFFFSMHGGNLAGQKSLGTRLGGAWEWGQILCVCIAITYLGGMPTPTRTLKHSPARRSQL